MIGTLDRLADTLEARGHRDLATQIDRIAEVVGRRPALVKKTREEEARETIRALELELRDAGDENDRQRIRDELRDARHKLHRYGSELPDQSAQRPINPVFVERVSDDSYVSRATLMGRNASAQESIPLVPGILRDVVQDLHAMEAQREVPVTVGLGADKARQLYRALDARINTNWGVGRVSKTPEGLWYHSDAGTLCLMPPGREAPGWRATYTSDPEGEDI